MLLLVAYNMLLTGLIQNGDSGGVMFYACAILMVVLSVAYFYRTLMIKLPGVVREVLKMEGKKRSDIPK